MLKDLETYFNKIPAEMFCDKSLWLSVGNIIYDYTRGNKKGFELWCKFSKQIPEYEREMCRLIWNEFEKKINFDVNEMFPIPDGY